MLTALLFAILTGVTWTVSGIVISRCAKKEFDLFSFSVLYALLSAVLSLILFTRWISFVLNGGFCLLTVLLMIGGANNAFSQNLVRKAMEKGNHASIWAMMQTFMLFPFFFGLIVFHETCGLWKSIGITFMLAGVFFPCLKGFSNIRGWFVPVLFALLLCGTGQILYLVSARWDAVSDPAQLRPALVCLGNAAGWIFLTGFEHKKLHYGRKLLTLIVVVSLIYATGMGCFFKALDLFANAGKSCIAIPMTAGTNIAAFHLYSFIFLKEKRSVSEMLSTLAILLGLALAAMG